MLISLFVSASPVMRSFSLSANCLSLLYCTVELVHLCSSFRSPLVSLRLSPPRFLFQIPGYQVMIIPTQITICSPVNCEGGSGEDYFVQNGWGWRGRGGVQGSYQPLKELTELHNQFKKYSLLVMCASLHLGSYNLKRPLSQTFE